MKKTVITSLSATALMLIVGYEITEYRALELAFFKGK